MRTVGFVMRDPQFQLGLEMTFMERNFRRFGQSGTRQADPTPLALHPFEEGPVRRGALNVIRRHEAPSGLRVPNFQKASGGDYHRRLQRFFSKNGMVQFNHWPRSGFRPLDYLRIGL